MQYDILFHNVAPRARGTGVVEAMWLQLATTFMQSGESVSVSLSPRSRKENSGLELFWRNSGFQGIAGSATGTCQLTGYAPVEEGNEQPPRKKTRGGATQKEKNAKRDRDKQLWVQKWSKLVPTWSPVQKFFLGLSKFKRLH
jgi:hypothetical protein